MVTHRPHKPEIPGPNPGLPQPYRRIQQSFSFENSLAHLVEHLSVKQSVIGSSPIIISLMRLVYGSVAQLVERKAEALGVVSSNLTWPTSFKG